MQFKIKDNLRASIESFLSFFISILYFELLLRLWTVEDGAGIWALLLFIPGEALFFTLFCGFFKNKTANRILSLALLFFVSIFYIIQLLYFKQFGSPLSVSLIKMGGEAITDFWWAFKETLIKSLGYLLLFLLPLVLETIFLFTNFSNAEKINLSFKGLLLIIIVVLWISAIELIRLGGKEKPSAYYVLTNAYSDTETSAEKLGYLTTTVIESGAYFFGINSNNDNPSFSPVSIEYPTVSYLEAVSSNKEIIPIENVDSEEKPVIRYHFNEQIDFEYLKSVTDDPDIQSLCDYFASKPATSENEYTGLFEGYNLIYICAESFTTYAMNEKLTPLLCEMSQNGIVLNNYYTSFKNTTTNGEFSFSVSLWPDVSRAAADGNAVGSFACSSNNYMPYGLGNIFNSLNVPTYAFHGYISSYYRRCDSWPNLGYKNMKFMNEGLTFKNKWSPADTELMEQTVDDFISEDRFFTYYMTYSGHGGYTTATYMYKKNNQAVRELLNDDTYSDSEISYYCGNYELEKALEYLVEKLRESRKLEKTVIVIAGDHIPYNLSNEEMEDLSKRSGLSYDNNFEKYKSTCIIYNAGIEEPIISDDYCCTVDILPTVLNLMGIDYDSRLISGLDVFDSSLHRARLYNGNLITEFVNYNSGKGNAIWKNEATEWTDTQKEDYIDTLTTYSDNEYMVALKMMEKDFYRFVWDNLQ